ncbi:MAG: hypothetical protein WCG35_03480 [Betaproteobacteria bacterium]
MSKTNPTQVAALAAPTKEVEATKPVASKPVVAKTVAAKSAPAKTSTTASSTKVTPEKVVKAVVVKAAAVKAKPAKVEKTPKLKMERDSFTMPKVEYTQFSVLKGRLIKLGQPAKKSELLRAGIMQLSAMTDAALKAAIMKVPTIKTGRPNKK